MSVVKEILLPNLDALSSLASRLAPLLNGQEVLLLHGALGAGKTTFVRCLIKSLGVSGDVPSPTFTLVQSYETPDFPVFHFDLYRLKQPEEIEEIGFDDALAEGLVLVEWPEKALPYMPRSAFRIHFGIKEDGTHFVQFEHPDLWGGRLDKVMM